MRRVKDKTLSPYNTGDTDARDFPSTNGEVLDAVDYIALADDIAALVDRLIAAENNAASALAVANAAASAVDALSEFEIVGSSLTVSKAYVIFDGSGGAGQELSLPGAVVGGERFTVVNASTDSVDISSSTGGIGNDASPSSSFTLYPEESLSIVFDGTNWRVI